MSDELVLAPEWGALGFAVFAIIKMLGAESMRLDEDDNAGLIKLARVGLELVIAERPGDPKKGKPHRYTCYRVDATERGELFAARLAPRIHPSPRAW